MKRNINNIFIDTNVLIGMYLERPADVECLRYLFSLKGKKLFISALSVAQFIAFFQRKMPNAKIKEIINYFFTKFIIIEFNEKDIQNALRYEYTDLEDTIQYIVGSKLNCFYFVTNDRHFNTFLNINALKSSEIRTVKR